MRPRFAGALALAVAVAVPLFPVAAATAVEPVAATTPFPPATETLRPTPKAVRAELARRLAASQGRVADLAAALDAAIRDFRQLLGQTDAFQQRNRDLSCELKLRTTAGLPLRGEDLDRLNQSLCEGVVISRALFATADLNAFWHDPDPKELTRAGLPPALPVELRVKGSLLAVAAALRLYDLYHDNVEGMLGNEKVRAALARGDRGYALRQRLLQEIAAEYLSPSSRLRARAELAFCANNLAAATARHGEEDDFRFLCEQVAQSPARTRLSCSWLTLPFRSLMDHTVVRTLLVGQDVKWLGEESLNGISLAFGNSVGLVATRTGKLRRDPALADALAPQLRAGDILLEKTPFRLTDRFIPGHWGHAAIWIGTEAELRQLGLWEHPLVQPHQPRIRDGGRIVEALRDGVALNSLQQFLNIDDLAVLRERGTDGTLRRQRILLAMRQLGKKYDFNFDVETTDRIVCSELIYTVFTGIAWPTGKTLGRHTITPDNVAAGALDGGPFDLVLFYHDGAPVTDQPAAVMGALMRLPPPQPPTAD